MRTATSTPSLERPFDNVNTSDNPSISPGPGTMIHHKYSTRKPLRIIVSWNTRARRPYGVPKARRVLPPELLLKRFDQVRGCLDKVIGLTVAQREVALRLLRIWSYYGYVYPKQATITAEPGCKKSTYWRTISLLKSLGLIEVINRFVIRDHAQISNLYRLDQLVLVLARYIAERRGLDCPAWLEPVLIMPARDFYSFLTRRPEARSGPALPAFDRLLRCFSA